jgi:hypothetical protein
VGLLSFQCDKGRERYSIKIGKKASVGSILAKSNQKTG